MVVLAPHGEVAKSLPVVSFATNKLLVSVDAIVEVELLATTLAGKQLATVLSNFVMVRHWQIIESLVTDITGMTIYISCALSPQTGPIQHQH